MYLIFCHKQEAAKKKKQIEKIRRKNYEIKTLKEELQHKHSELCHTTTRLANLENDFVSFLLVASSVIIVAVVLALAALLVVNK